MHELAITKGIIDIVNSEAEKSGFKNVLEITLRVGEYSGIVPECLREFFPIAAAGSEMSPSCVITNDQTGEKRAYDDDFSRPKFAVMNPELTETLPDYQTQSGCTDIMMHTMERYFGVNAGANEITVEAGGRIGLTETYTVTYTAPSFRIDTLFSDGQTRTVTADTPSGGSETVTVEGGSENARVWVSVEGVTGLETLEELRLDGRRLSPGADGGYAAALDPRTPVTLTLYYTDPDGASREYSYILRFQRIGGGGEETQQPTISAQIEADGTTMGLTDGLVLKNPAVLLLVEGRSAQGEQLYSNNFTVTVNGTVIPAPTSQTGSLFGYDAYLLYEGANTITVTAVDNDGVSASRTWTVYYEAGQITVTVSVEATTVGLGTLVPYVSVTVPGGTDALTILEQALAQYEQYLNQMLVLEEGMTEITGILLEYDVWHRYTAGVFSPTYHFYPVWSIYTAWSCNQPAMMIHALDGTEVIW